MRFRWAALTAVLTFLLMPQLGQAQGTTQGTAKRPAVTLKQNYPNPFNPEAWFPFDIDCKDDAQGTQHTVSLRIYNLLAQLVAIPVIQGGTGSVAGGQPLENVLLTCGSYTAFWNGNYRNTSNEAASGTYIYILEVDGKRTVKKMMSSK